MFNKIEEALEDFKNGKLVIVVDDENRENEGDFIVSADKATEETVNFMLTYGRGLMCVPITEERAKELNLKDMHEDNTDFHKTAFTVSVDAIEDTTTGISVSDRLKTLKDLSNPSKKEKDFRKPGHIFPLVAKSGGVLVRKGHTEAAVDLCRLTNQTPVAAIIEILNEDGTASRRDDLLKLSKEHNIKIITIDDLELYRKSNDKLVYEEVKAKLPTKYGDFKIVAYKNDLDDKEHVAIVKGDVENKDEVLVRLHSECLTGDIFGSKRCDCGDQLEKALRRIDEQGEGVVIYLRQEGRGIGLYNKLKAYNLQDEGYDTVEANHQLGFGDDLRDYSIAAQIVKDLKIKSVKLMTNNPRKINGLINYGVEVINREEHKIEPNEENEKYLETKKEKLGHMLD